MSTITKVPTVKTEREFFGKAWVNTIKKEGSKANGLRMINLCFDDEVQEVTIKLRDKVITLHKGDKIQLWPNAKREGKNDADLRASTVIK